MITRILRLATLEWYKVRLRWLPWILLGLLFLLFQAFLWGFYVAYHVSDEGLSGLIPDYEYASNTTSVTVTCADVLEGRVEEKIAPFSGDERRIVEEGVEEWRPSCAGYATREESRGAFTLPETITSTSDLLLILVPFILIFTASVFGVEYGWGTLRTTVTSGSGRWHLLAAKLIMVIVTYIAAAVILAIASAVSSILAGIIPPDEPGALVNSEGWRQAFESQGRAIYALIPYIVLAMFLTTLTQSTAQGTALSLVVWVIEFTVLPPLLGLVSALENVREFLLSDNVGEWMTRVTLQSQEITAEGPLEQPDPLQAFFVILAYIVVLGGATFWLFQRRDITGPRGE